MIYRIQRGSIAAVIIVTCLDTTERFECVYQAPGMPFAITRAGHAAHLPAETLPLTVRGKVGLMFGMVFSLPVNMRQPLIENSLPFEMPGYFA